MNRKRKEAGNNENTDSVNEINSTFQPEQESLSGSTAGDNDGYSSLHERNPYRNNPPDFCALAASYEEFAPFVHLTSSGIAAVDWRKPEAVLAVTKVLLKHDFGLAFEMPLNHLCPPIPQRLNYLLWVQDLLALMRIDASRYQVRGVDIGTGASCIFPLLGCTALGFHFLATEIDPESIESAQANIERNQLGSYIQVTHVEDRERILIGVLKEDEQFEFCVCNPPFFSTMEETGLNKKRACRATASELTCPGGELAFISRLIDDSSLLRSNIRWFTTMLGRKASLEQLKHRLGEMPGVTCTRTCEFLQGKQTRWGLAWTFDPNLPAALMPESKIKPKFQLVISGLASSLSSTTQTSSSFSASSQVSSNLSAVAAINIVQELFVQFGVETSIDLKKYCIKGSYFTVTENSTSPTSNSLSSAESTSFDAVHPTSDSTSNQFDESTSLSSSASSSSTPGKQLLFSFSVELLALPNKEFQLNFQLAEGEVMEFSRMFNWLNSAMVHLFRQVRKA